MQNRATASGDGGDEGRRTGVWSGNERSRRSLFWLQNHGATSEVTYREMPKGQGPVSPSSLRCHCHCSDQEILAVPSRGMEEPRTDGRFGWLRCQDLTSTFAVAAPHLQVPGRGAAASQSRDLPPCLASSISCSPIGRIGLRSSADPIPPRLCVRGRCLAETWLAAARETRA